MSRALPLCPAWPCPPHASLSLQIFTRLGKCYTFNSGAPGHELLTTVKGGTGNGLELMLNIQQDEYLPVWGDTGESGGQEGHLEAGAHGAVPGLQHLP